MKQIRLIDTYFSKEYIHLLLTFFPYKFKVFLTQKDLHEIKFNNEDIGVIFGTKKNEEEEIVKFSYKEDLTNSITLSLDEIKEFLENI